MHAAVIAAGAVAVLAFARGGALPGWTAPTSAALLLAASIEAARTRAGAWPVPLLALVSLPYLQVLPLRKDWWAALSPARAAVLPELQALGVETRTSVSIDAAATLEGAALLAGACACFVLARAGCATTRGAACLAAVVSAVAAAQALLGAEQYAAALSTGASEAAARGTFGSRGNFASFLLGGFGAACGLSAAAWRSTLRTRLETATVAGAAAALAALGVVLSFSRAGAAILAISLAGAVWAAAPGRRRWVAGAVGLAVLAGIAAAPEAARRLGTRFDDLAAGRDQGRFAIWADSAPLVNENALVGVGLGAYRYGFRRSAPYLTRKSVENAHCDYLELAAELGLPAFALSALLVGAALWGACRRTTRLARPEQALAAGMLLGAGAILLHAAVDFPLRLPATAMLTAALLGGACGLASPSGARRPTRALTTATTAALALLALAAPQLVEPLPQRFAAAEERYATKPAGAADGYRDVLRHNPFVAPAWLRLAAIARAEGRQAEALRWTRTAHAVEPFTLRTAWPLAEAELFEGDRDRGLAVLASALDGAPDLRPTAYRLAWRAGFSADRIENELAAPDAYAAGELLAFLARVEEWNRLPEAFARWGRTIGPRHREFLRKRLKEAGRRRELQRLEELGM